MPQAPSDLQEKWGDDKKALDHLAKSGIKPDRGGMFHIEDGDKLTAEDRSALDYLWLEWDYGCKTIYPNHDDSGTVVPADSR